MRASGGGTQVPWWWWANGVVLALLALVVALILAPGGAVESEYRGTMTGIEQPLQNLVPPGEVEYLLDPDMYNSSGSDGSDLDCSDVGHIVYLDPWDDPHELDADGDGIGCEAWGP